MRHTDRRSRRSSAAVEAHRPGPAPQGLRSSGPLGGGCQHSLAHPAHAVEPAVVVGRLALKVFGDLGMRQDQELLLTDALEDDAGDLLRLKSICGQELKPES